MTVKTLLQLSSILLIFTVGACTSDEEKAAVERKERIEQQEQKDAEAATRKAREAEDAHDKADQQAKQAEAEAAATPEPPAKVILYRFKNVTCQCYAKAECGISFWGCSDGFTYGCFHDVAYTTFEETKTDSNSSEGNCEN